MSISACFRRRPRPWNRGRFSVRSLVVKGAILTVLFLVCISLSDCRRQVPLAINVVLTAKGTASRILSRRLIDTGRDLHLSSGRRIFIDEVFVRADEFEKFTTSVSPVDIVICDSPQQLASSPVLQREAAAAVNVCGKAANCPGFIPSWVPSDRREAAKQVFRALQVE